MFSKKLFILFFILITPIAFAESMTVTRELPDFAVINYEFNVSINVLVDTQNPPIGYIITEHYPENMQIIDTGGADIYNPTERALEWLNYSMLVTNKNFTYKLKALTIGTKFFNGVTTAVKTDSQTETIATSGDSNMSITETSCLPNWQCTDFSPCLNENQTRTCTDINNCNTTQKPSEVRQCTCTPLWSCTSWSECDSGGQTRTCSDDNNCGTDAGKPAETQDCSSGSGGGGGGSGGGSSSPPCTPSWTCTDWTPTKCPSNEIQTRICTDEKKCNILTNKPSESIECDYVEAVKPIEKPKNDSKEEIINETKTDEKTPTGSTLTGIVSNNLLIIFIIICAIGASAFLFKRSKKTNITAYSYKPTNFYKI